MNLSQIKIGILLLLACAVWQCEKTVPLAETPDPQAVERLIFGQFYGMCFGPTCVETYRLENGKLFVDTADSYSKPFPYEGDWAERPASDYALAAPLLATIPEAIWQVDQETFGIPDAYDQGGYYLEIRRADGEHRAWRLDTNRDALPEFLRPYAQQLEYALEELEE